MTEFDIPVAFWANAIVGEVLLIADYLSDPVQYIEMSLRVDDLVDEGGESSDTFIQHRRMRSLPDRSVPDFGENPSSLTTETHRRAKTSAARDLEQSLDRI